MSDTVWSDAMIAQLRKAWGADHSCVAISKTLGVSKNAVIGKARRLGLDSRPSPIKRPGEPVAPKRAPVTPVGTSTLPAIAKAEQEPEPAIVFQPRQVGGCCWPLWGFNERPTHRYCDAPGRSAGEPYCATHRAKAVVVIGYRAAA